MKTQIAAAFLAIIALGSSLETALAAPDSPKKPNVIFILADDLGYGDLGSYGQKLIKTPNLDRLATEGTRFTQAYAGAAVCAPSRCSLMTGMHNGHAAIRGNREIKPEGQQPMPADTFTAGHLMKNAGYATAIIGKWGLGHPGSDSTPDKMGFDYFFGYNCQRKAHEHYPPSMWRNNEIVELGGKHYSHDLFVDESLKFIREKKDEPFFLYLAFTIPHFKLQVPDLAPYENEPWDNNLKTLAAMITRLDSDVGQVLRLVKELNLDDNTLVIFASDHGAQHQDKLFNHSGVLRGFKGDLYEGGLRTPAIVRWPGKVPAGVASDQIWAFWDFLPTMAELTGQPTPAGIDGISMLPAFLGKTPVKHLPLYFEFFQRGFEQAARIDDWKAYRPEPGAPLEIYDLANDLSETRNIAADHPEVVKRFEDYFATARTDSTAFPIRVKKK